MKLEAKYLAPYLPYELKIYASEIHDKFTCEMVVSNTTVSLKAGLNINEVIYYNAKPILRPLSYLEKKITVGEETFIPLVKLLQLKYHKYYLEHKEDRYGKIDFDSTSAWFAIQANYEVKIMFWPEDIFSYPEHWILEKLFQWHFDVFGLIKEGLAIDINTIKTN